MERLHAIVKGSVQSVGFRYWARREAHFLGLTGWVRNLPDHSVEVVAEGDRATLIQFLGGLRAGPSGASVESVVPSFSAASGEFSDFRIL